jgi:acyl carrier protein
MHNVDELCTLIQQVINESQDTAEETVEPDTPLLMSGLLDSLTIMRIVTQVERRTGVTFPETAVVASNFRTPTALWEAVGTIRRGLDHEGALS